MKNVSELIVVDPEICGGKPVVKGTRVPVEYIIHLTRRGFSTKRIAAEFDLPEKLMEKVIIAVQKLSTLKFV